MEVKIGFFGAAVAVESFEVVVMLGIGFTFWLPDFEDAGTAAADLMVDFTVISCFTVDFI